MMLAGTFTQCTGVILKFDLSIIVGRHLTLSIHLKDTNTLMYLQVWTQVDNLFDKPTVIIVTVMEIEADMSTCSFNNVDFLIVRQISWLSRCFLFISLTKKKIKRKENMNESGSNDSVSLTAVALGSCFPASSFCQCNTFYFSSL